MDLDMIVNDIQCTFTFILVENLETKNGENYEEIGALANNH